MAATTDCAGAGFFIGDGAGVGKGRQIAGIIMDNYARGRRRAVWVSTSSDLHHDAERDLQDLGCAAESCHTICCGHVLDHPETPKG